MSNVVFIKYLVLRSRYHVTIYFIRRDSVLYHIFFNGINFAVVNKFKVLSNYAPFLVGPRNSFPHLFSHSRKFVRHPSLSKYGIMLIAGKSRMSILIDNWMRFIDLKLTD